MPKLNIDSGYARLLKMTKPLKDFASGDPELIATSEYIPPYKSELTNEAQSMGRYRNRIQRTPVMPFSGQIVNEHVYTCSRDIAIEYPEALNDDPILVDIRSNVDGLGEDAQLALARGAELYFRDGRFAILVESPTAVDAETRSYQTRYESCSILALERFMESKRGQIRRVLLLNAPTPAADNKLLLNAREYFFESDAAANYIQIDWQSEPVDPNAMKDISEIEFHEMGRVEGSIPKIPVVIFGRGPKDSAISSVVPMDKAVLNYNSIISNVIYAKGFSRTIFTGVEADQISDLDEQQALCLPSSDSSVTELSPDDPAAMREERNFLAHMAKRFGMRQFKQAQDDLTKQVQSAESKAKDLESLGAYYNQTLDMFEKWLREVYQLHLMFLRSDASKETLDGVKVSINRDFGLSDTEYQLQVDMYVEKLATRYGKAGDKVILDILRRRYIDMRVIPHKSGEERTEKEERLRELDDAAAGTSETAPPPAFSRNTTGLGIFSQQVNNGGVNTTADQAV